MNCELESLLLSILATGLFIFALYAYPTKLPRLVARFYYVQNHLLFPIEPLIRSLFLTRNDPFVIKTRFIGICIVSVISLYVLGRYDKYDLNELSFDFFDRDFLVNGLLKPLIVLLVIQFIPILMLAQELLEEGGRFFNEFTIVKLRDYLMAPFTEELVYRYILLKTLQPCYSPTSACLISSFLFGFSHFHHYLLNRFRDRTLTASCCQFTFSFLFGVFAGSMYLKSTYLITPFVLHAVCNLIMLPDFDQIGSSYLLTVSTIFTFSFGLYLAVVL